jgi:hypothetical protein
MTSIAVNEFSAISIARPGSAAILASASIAILAADAISLKAAAARWRAELMSGSLIAQLLRSQSSVVITDGIGVGRAELRKTPRERSQRVIALEEFLGALLDAPRAIVSFSIHRNSPLGRHHAGASLVAKPELWSKLPGCCCAARTQHSSSGLLIAPRQAV